jgi:peptidoglycan/LPS O-acetylase OafA/YrhL
MTFDLFIDISKLAHGSFNTLLALVFFYQAWMGLSIRRGRKRGDSRVKAMRRHRRLGPFLVVLGILGYCLGVILVYIDKGRVFEYPPHLAVGSVIVLFLLGQYAVSRKIKGMESSWRTPHLAIGVGIILLYVLQIVVGVSVLL